MLSKLSRAVYAATPIFRVSQAGHFCPMASAEYAQRDLDELNDERKMSVRRPSVGTSIVLGIGILALLTASVVSADGNRRAKRIPTPHEVHEYQQVKFLDEPLWRCRLEGGADGCVACRNPTQGAFIVEVKSNYKRADWNIRTDTQEVREHCVYPDQEFWACLSTNMVIEPDPGTRPDVAGDPTSCPPLN